MIKTFNARTEHLLVQHEVFTPRYHDKDDGDGEYICLIPCYKVDAGGEWQKVKFTKAKHLLNLRYCIKRSEAIRCTVQQVKRKHGPGYTAMYEIPEHLWHTWDRDTEIINTVNQLGW